MYHIIPPSIGPLKNVSFAAILLICTASVFGQGGSVNFNNRAGFNLSVPPGAVIAPFYNLDPANSNVRKTGNDSIGLPSGSQTYGGPRLFGTNYIAALWARNSSSVVGNAFNNNLALIDQTVMRTNQMGTLAGLVVPTIPPPRVPDVTDASQRGTFQVRVWDSRGGTILTWDQVLADPTIPRGFSDLFTVPFPLGNLLAPPNTPPNLQGLESFQLFLPLPGAPVLACSEVLAECTGGLTPVIFNTSAVDMSGNPLPVFCTPPSGSGFRLGASNVVCSATDTQGNSTTCAFTVRVVDTTPPQVTCSANISVRATNSSGNVITYVAGASDACGIASFDCSPPSGTIFSVGLTTVLCKATDSVGNSNGCTFTVSVQGNEPPTCVLRISCAVPFNNALQLIALNDAHACVILDATGSTDPDGDPLSFGWLLDDTFALNLDPAQEPEGGGTGSGSGAVTLVRNSLAININFSGLSANSTEAHIHGSAPRGVNAAVLYPLNSITTLGSTEGTISGTVTLIDGTGGFTVAQQLDQLQAGLWYINIHTTTHPGGEIRGQLEPTLSGALAANCFGLGCHSVVLTVSDGTTVSRCQTNLCVLTACDAVAQCIALVDGSALPRRNKQPLVASLKTACALFDEGQFVPAMNSLEAFQAKVAAQIAPANPAIAQAFIDCAQQILDMINCAAILANNGDGAPSDGHPPPMP